MKRLWKGKNKMNIQELQEELLHRGVVVTVGKINSPVAAIGRKANSIIIEVLNETDEGYVDIKPCAVFIVRTDECIMQNSPELSEAHQNSLLNLWVDKVCKSIYQNGFTHIFVYVEPKIVSTPLFTIDPTLVENAEDFNLNDVVELNKFQVFGRIAGY
jgi:hypothetical protein